MALQFFKPSKQLVLIVAPIYIGIESEVFVRNFISHSISGILVRDLRPAGNQRNSKTASNPCGSSLFFILEITIYERYSSIIHDVLLEFSRHGKDYHVIHDPFQDHYDESIQEACSRSFSSLALCLNILASSALLHASAR